MNAHGLEVAVTDTETAQFLASLVTTPDEENWLEKRARRLKAWRTKLLSTPQPGEVPSDIQSLARLLINLGEGTLRLDNMHGGGVLWWTFLFQDALAEEDLQPIVREFNRSHGFLGTDASCGNQDGFNPSYVHIRPIKPEDFPTSTFLAIEARAAQIKLDPGKYREEVKTRKASGVSVPPKKAAPVGPLFPGAPTGFCTCGCGGPAKRRFLQGHDARFYGQLKRYLRGDLTEAQVSNTVKQAASFGVQPH